MALIPEQVAAIESLVAQRDDAQRARYTTLVNERLAQERADLRAAVEQQVVDLQTRTATMRAAGQSLEEQLRATTAELQQAMAPMAELQTQHAEELAKPQAGWEAEQQRYEAEKLELQAQLSAARTASPLAGSPGDAELQANMARIARENLDLRRQPQAAVAGATRSGGDVDQKALLHSFSEKKASKFSGQLSSGWIGSSTSGTSWPG